MANQNAKNSKNKKSTTKKNNNNKKVVAKENVKKEIKKEEKVVLEERPISKEVKNDNKKVEAKKEEKKSFKLTSKQKDIVLILLVVVLLVVACIVTTTKKETVNIDLPATVVGEAGTHTITYSDYEEMMNSENPFLMIIIQDGCGYCEAYEPIVEEVANEYAIPVYYLNLTSLSKEESTKLNKSNSYLRTQSWGTPTTLFMYKDNVIDSIGQYADKDEFVKFVKENIKVESDE